MVRATHNIIKDNDDSLICTSSIYYADDGLLSGENKDTVQKTMDITTELFKKVGLEMNENKSKIMINNIGNLQTRICKEAYSRRLEGKGLSYKERLTSMVNCPKCDKKMQMRNLENHLKKLHGHELNFEIEDEQKPKKYKISSKTCKCPVHQCPYGHENKSNINLRRHFAYIHAQDVLIFKEENMVRCVHCLMYINRNKLEKHLSSILCKNLTKRNKNIKLQRKNVEATNESFMINKKPVENVKEFKYLGRYMNAKNDDWSAITRNIEKSQKRWASVKRVLCRDKSSTRTMGYFYKAIIQSILLYGSESWVLTDSMLMKLEAFHKKIARNITNCHIRPDPQNEGEWIYPDTESVLKKASLLPIEEYIKRRKNTISQYAQNDSARFQQCLSYDESLSNKKYWWNTLENR